MGGLKSALIAAALVAALSSCRQAPVGEEPSKLALPTGAPDTLSDDTITLVPPGYERAASSLSYLFQVAGDVFGTVDPIDGDILFLDRQGKQLGAARLPDGFMVRDVEVGSSIVLRGDTSAVAIPRSGAIPALLQAIPLPKPSTSVARTGRSLRMTYPAAAGARTLIVAPQKPGQVLNVTFLGFDKAGAPYVYWEEGSGPRVDAWVGRFSGEGKLSAGARLDFSDFEDVPAVPVAVVSDGTVLMVQPNEESIDLYEIDLTPGRVGEAQEKRVGSARVDVLDVGNEAKTVADVPYKPVKGPAPAYNPAFGAAALARGRELLDAEWTLRPDNFLQSGIVHNCEPESGQYWSRPSRLSEARVGTIVRSLPYKWGGFDNAQSFIRRVEAAKPALAGDVCTCREAAFGGCIVARAAGVDCSGFISRAWGLGAHNGTYNLAKLAAPLPSYFDLKPGDILNRPGNHVRLFVRFEPGPEVRLGTLESSVSCGGVCEKIYTPAQLQFYRPMRLRRAG